MYCKTCHKEINVDPGYCRICGTIITDENLIDGAKFRKKFIKVQKLCSRGEYLSANKLMRKLISKKRKNPIYQFWLGYTYYQLKDRDNALKHFDKALDLEPEYLPAEIWKAMLRCQDLGNNSEEFFKKLVDENPDNVIYKDFLEQVENAFIFLDEEGNVPEFLKDKVHESDKKYTSTIYDDTDDRDFDEFMEGLKDIPNEENFNRDLMSGGVDDPFNNPLYDQFLKYEENKKKEEKKKHNEKLKNYDKQIKENPNDIALLLKKINTLFDVEDYDKILECSNLILNIDEENTEGIVSKACALERSGRYEECVEYSKTVDLDLLNDKDKSDICYHFGFSYLKLGDLEKMAEYFVKSANLAKDPYDDMFHTLEWIQSEFDYPEVIRAYDAILDIEEDNIPTLVFKAEAYEEDNFELAVDTYKLALKYDPESSNALWGLEDLYEYKGMEKEAKEIHDIRLKVDKEGVLRMERNEATLKNIAHNLSLIFEHEKKNRKY